MVQQKKVFQIAYFRDSGIFMSLAILSTLRPALLAQLTNRSSQGDSHMIIETI